MKIILFVVCTAILFSGPLADPNPSYSYYGAARNPYYKFYDYTLRNEISYPHHIPFRPVDTYTFGAPSAFNVLAEVPFSIGNTFTVVPMVVVAKENMKMVNKGEIMTVSKQKPQMTLKTEHNNILDCTPAVKIVLDTPIFVYSLKSSIVFPSYIEIVHQSYKIPIKVGSVVAPIAQHTFVSVETPVSLNVIYAIPSEPLQIDYVNNQGILINNDGDSVIVESSDDFGLPPRNVTVLEFPTAQAQPVLQVDEEDDILDNRNNPIFLAPAGIVQSTQPQSSIEPFSNSKESPVLILLREEAKKKRL